jgi:CheY-like chemotaxis protein
MARIPVGEEMQMARILIAEDELILALDTETLLREAGHDVVGPVSSPSAVLRLIGAGGIDAALLDVRLRNDELVYPACDALIAKGIPFAFATACGYDVIPARYRNTPVLHKPFTDKDVARVLRGLLAGSEGSVVAHR